MSGFKPRTWVVELYQGDWQQRIEDAAKAVDKARANDSATPRTLSDVPDEIAAIQTYNELLDAAVDERVLVTLQAVGRKKWAELIEANPPRTDESLPEYVRKNDADLGVNDQALGDALVPLSIISIEPEMDADELLEQVSSAQFDLLYGRAFQLNRGVGADPKAVPRLTPSQSSNGTEN